MALSSTSRPGIRGRVIPRIPTTLQAAGGLAVSKENGVWTFEPDWTVLALETTLPDPENRQLWVYDPLTETYNRLSLQAVIDELPDGPPGSTGAAGPGYTATSVSSQAIASSGDKTFTVAAGLAYTAGARVRAADAGAPTVNWMEGVVTSYSGTTLMFTADKSAGSGTLTNWTINVAGEPGASGAGTGDVIGPASATNNAIALFDLTTGKLIKDSATTIASISPVGKQTVWVPAAAMLTRITNGAAPSNIELTTNKNILRTMDFDTATQEFVQFEILMPKGWNESTITFKPVWSHAATVTSFGVVWGLAAVATSDDDAGDVAFGTAQTSTDTGGTTNDIYIGPESSAITIAGSPAELDRVHFQINRTVADGSDTMTIDARLHGVHVYITTSAPTDT